MSFNVGAGCHDAKYRRLDFADESQIQMNGCVQSKVGVFYFTHSSPAAALSYMDHAAGQTRDRSQGIDPCPTGDAALPMQTQAGRKEGAVRQKEARR